MVWAGFWPLLGGFWGSQEDSNFEDEGDTRKSSLGPAGDSSPEGFQEASEKVFWLTWRPGSLFWRHSRCLLRDSRKLPQSFFDYVACAVAD